jgi:hypothetical protein
LYGDILEALCQRLRILGRLNQQAGPGDLPAVGSERVGRVELCLRGLGVVQLVEELRAEQTAVQQIFLGVDERQERAQDRELLLGRAVKGRAPRLEYQVRRVGIVRDRFVQVAVGLVPASGAAFEQSEQRVQHRQATRRRRDDLELPFQSVDVI